MKSNEIAVCIFSYNQGSGLRKCVNSFFDMAPDLDLYIFDDASDNQETLTVIEEAKNSISKIFYSERITTHGEKKRHGNLYENMQSFYLYCIEKNYKYMFFVQDDMQLVRPIDSAILLEYGRIFDADDSILQIDPRFLRKEINPMINTKLGVYEFAKEDHRGAYADVGIIKIAILKKLKWKFLDSEGENKAKLKNEGLRRVFPYTPVIMHLPFPKLYRRRKRKMSLKNNGKPYYKYMDQKECNIMDTRGLDVIPYYKSFLITQNMNLYQKIIFHNRKDRRIF